MRVNHINLQVSNVSQARTFFEKHFGMECKFQRRDELAILDDGAGMFMCFGPERIMIEVRGPAG